MSDITREEVMRRIDGLDQDRRKKMVCALVGHSKIQRYCFGYFYCARCGAEVGDNLGSMYFGAKDAVVVGHNCDQCRANYKKCTWRDTFMAPDPFAPDEGE